MAKNSFNGFIAPKRTNFGNSFIRPKKDTNKSEFFTKFGSKTYVFNGGPLTNILGLSSAAVQSLPTNSNFYLKYRINTKLGPKSILVSCLKDSSNRISQSGFSLLDQTFSFTGSILSPISRSNDDHDSLLMLPNGTGIISTTNSNAITGNWDRYKGSVGLDYGNSTDTVFGDYASNISTKIGTTNAGAAISFPLTDSMVFLNGPSSLLYINNSNGIPFDSKLIGVFSGLTLTQNNILILSDGVNNFLIYRNGQSSAVLVSIDLESEQYTTELLTYSIAGAFPNSTEEDAFGDVLYAVDGSWHYHSGGIIYQDSTPWIQKSSLSATWSSGQLGANTQSGMDLFGSFDSDGYVWFSDWGHDDGGFFYVGVDTQIGTRKTNILCLRDKDFIV